ncbi:hypothetical protein A9Y76_06955 [Ralstonia insidiosa]|uniref:Uncharacterized protein n=1 Tax=Ralstonia insidiosa TaxID=190721 RepID=A0A191ZVV3_9RALS|nr:hypothetical protein [Ralstonia insidiosa]ANJ72216.1 hypothetical protein A9Y76_06955 [Ralstonia insidiosa]
MPDFLLLLLSTYDKLSDSEKVFWLTIIGITIYGLRYLLYKFKSHIHISMIKRILKNKEHLLDSISKRSSIDSFEKLKDLDYRLAFHATGNNIAQYKLFPTKINVDNQLSDILKQNQSFMDEAIRNHDYFKYTFLLKYINELMDRDSEEKKQTYRAIYRSCLDPLYDSPMLDHSTYNMLCECFVFISRFYCIDFKKIDHHELEKWFLHDHLAHTLNDNSNKPIAIAGQVATRKGRAKI